MSSNKDKIFTSIPGAVWLFGGIKLTKSALFLFIQASHNRLPHYALLTILAVFLGKIKFRLCLLKSVNKQLLMSYNVPERISHSEFLKNIFLSKKMAIVLSIAVISAVLCSQIKSSPCLFLIRLTVGTALLRAAFAYLTPQSAKRYNP